MRSYRSVVLVLAALAVPAGPSRADRPLRLSAGERSDSMPSDEVLEQEGAVIGEITVRVEDVFNPEMPGEDLKFYRLANRLHVDTRPGVVRAQLLFESGEPYSTSRIRETERLLRSHRYLYDCVIKPVHFDGRAVDLDVWVKDVWTFKAGAALSRSGGANSTRFELEDRNLLGSGRSVTLRRERDVDRTSVSARYLDRNVLGSWTRLSLVYSDDSDGNRAKLELGRPFYSLDTRWATDFAGLAADRIDSLYSLGVIARQFRHKQEAFELEGGVSRGLINGRARRFTFGLSYERDSFDPLPGVATGTFAPQDRTLAYPWLGIESVQDSFATTRNLDQLSRTEDISLGNRYRARVGLASASVGSDRSQAVFKASTESGWKPAAAQTLLLSTAALGRYGAGDFENLVVGGSARYYWRNLERGLFFATAEATLSKNLDADSQILLGGDTGLRGYPLRYQDGKARFLITVEQRFFTDMYPLRLFYVGAAVFFDAGRTWAGESSLSPNLGLLKDAGIGLRFASSRSGFGTVFHFDLAFPLDGDSSIDSVQWLVTTKKSL